MKKIIITSLLITILFLGCKSCGSPVDKTPNIREEPGKEACPAFCDHMLSLGQNDPSCLEYLLGETDTKLCVEWCVHSQENSIQLNPACMSTVSRCDQVDCASRIAPDQCVDIDTLCL